MQTVLFHSTIFGPVHSRRLGTSLGINLMPNDGKICSFDCLYCEAGFNAQGQGSSGLPSRENVASELERKLGEMKNEGSRLDVITFSGNGEPTLHPEFENIITDTIKLRDQYFPQVKISVLSNATRIGRASVAEALRKVDNNILKLDSAISETVEKLDRPVGTYDVEKTIEQLSGFAGQAIIQTMFTSGAHGGKTVDNTTETEVDALIEAYKRIRPREIMIYTIDRQTPERSLKHITTEQLEDIAGRIRKATGIEVQVSG